MSELNRTVGHPVGVRVGWYEEVKHLSFGVRSGVSKNHSRIIRSAEAKAKKFNEGGKVMIGQGQ